jgi:hypothetical protein
MAEKLGRRAHSAAEFAQAMGTLIVPSEVDAARGRFCPLPSDVIIAPYSKCGTTWLQQTFHVLRTGGDADYDDISRVVPWIEMSSALGQDLNEEQRAQPRGFKSHLAYDAVPKGARYVISLREPKDALVSMYKFMEGWLIEPGTVSIEEFAAGWLMGSAGGSDYWDHLASWWNQRNNPNVLILSFAQMLHDPSGHIRRLADFCDIKLDDDLLALTLEKSSFHFMLDNKHQFDDAMMRALSEDRVGVPSGSDSAKVREGKVGSHLNLLPQAVADAVDAAWADRIPVEWELSDFAAVEAALAMAAA